MPAITSRDNRRAIFGYAVPILIMLSAIFGGLIFANPLHAFQRPVSAESEWLKIRNCASFNNWVGKYGGLNKKSRAQISNARKKFCPPQTVQAKPKATPKPKSTPKAKAPVRAVRSDTNKRPANTNRGTSNNRNTAPPPTTPTGLYQLARQAENRRNAAEARRLYRRSCNEDYALACHMLGKSYWGPEKNQTFYKKDNRLSIPFAEQACLLSVTQKLSAKYSYCFNAAILKVDGASSPSAAAAAVRRYYELSGRKLKTEECGQWPKLCGTLGRAYLLGNSGVANLTEARRLLIPSCEKRIAYSCNLAGLSYTNYTGRNYALGTQYYEKSCIYGHKPACSNARIAHSIDFYKQVSPVKARSYFEKSFAGNVNISQEIDKFTCTTITAQECRILGLGYAQSTPKNYNYAIKLLRKGCAAKDYESCAQQGRIYEYGAAGGRRNYGAAHFVYNKACEKGNAPSCSGLARIYRNTRSGYYNTKSASRYSRIATCLNAGRPNLSCQKIR